MPAITYETALNRMGGNTFSFLQKNNNKDRDKTDCIVVDKNARSIKLADCDSQNIPTVFHAPFEVADEQHKEKVIALTKRTIEIKSGDSSDRSIKEKLRNYIFLKCFDQFSDKGIDPHYIPKSIASLCVKPFPTEGDTNQIKSWLAHINQILNDPEEFVETVLETTRTNRKAIMPLCLPVPVSALKHSAIRAVLSLVETKLCLEVAVKEAEHRRPQATT